MSYEELSVALKDNLEAQAELRGSLIEGLDEFQKGDMEHIVINSTGTTGSARARTALDILQGVINDIESLSRVREMQVYIEAERLQAYREMVRQHNIREGVV